MVYCTHPAWQTDASFYIHNETGNDSVSDENYKSWMCIICGWVYEEEAGSPGDGLAPGTRWDDIPDDWICPDCGAEKEDFDMIEI